MFTGWRVFVRAHSRSIRTCPSHRNASADSANQLQSEVGDPQFKLIGIESYSSETGRLFHRPSAHDILNVNSARKQSLHDPLVAELSGTRIPCDRRDPRPISHGFTHYGQLFTPRQLLSLSLIASTIREIKDPEIKYTMALALSDTAGNNNRMCRYAADWLKLTPAFGLHGFHVVTRPVEGNVWGADRGRGSFRNCVKKAMRAYITIRSAINEVELARKKRSIREIKCLPAQDISELRWDSMDAIVTDPPYFDNLDYGELSDFYYQWLRIALENEPPFNRDHSLNDSDIGLIASTRQDAEKFTDELSQIFEQAVANLKPNGVVAFSYHHAKTRAWECLAYALRQADVAPYRVKFVLSELDNGFHSANGNIKIDAIFYCRRRNLLKDVLHERMIADAMGSLSTIERVKSVDLASAHYALATALMALIPSGDFIELLSYVRQEAKWE